MSEWAGGSGETKQRALKEVMMYVARAAVRERMSERVSGHSDSEEQ